MKNFETVVKDICAKTKTKVPKVVPYKLRIYTAWCSGDRISYHPIKISKQNYKYSLHIAAHEIGHIKYSERDRTIAEYKAELFALRTIKKYYPNYFTLSFTKGVIKKHIKWYSAAFRRALNDYKKNKTT